MSKKKKALTPKDVVNFRNDATTKKVADIFIMDVIDKWWGENLPKVKELVDQEKPTKINLHIVNCPGGDLGEALAIKSFLKDYDAPVKGVISGFVASAATVVAMGCDEVVMKEDALWLVHNGSTGVWGNKEEIKKVLNDLETVDSLIANIYVGKTGMDKEEVEHLMNENKWITAEQAHEYGFVDQVVQKVKIAASIFPQDVTADSFKVWNLEYPSNLKPFVNTAKPEDKPDSNSPSNTFDAMKKEFANFLTSLKETIQNAAKIAAKEEKPEGTADDEGNDDDDDEEEVTIEQIETELTEATKRIDEEAAKEDGEVTAEQATKIKNQIKGLTDELKKLKGAKSGGASASAAPVQTETGKTDRETMNKESLMNQVKAFSKGLR